MKQLKTKKDETRRESRTREETTCEGGTVAAKYACYGYGRTSEIRHAWPGPVPPKAPVEGPQTTSSNWFHAGCLHQCTKSELLMHDLGVANNPVPKRQVMRVRLIHGYSNRPTHVKALQVSSGCIYASVLSLSLCGTRHPTPHERNNNSNDNKKKEECMLEEGHATS